jgi:FkbM family methyltransferase
MQKIGAEHTVEVDLLPESPFVLDVGCRGFEFDIELLKLRPKATIIALDPDPGIGDPQIPGIVFIQAAVTERDTPGVIWQGPGEGAYICGNPGDPGYGFGVRNSAESASVPNLTVEQILKQNQREHFDLVKLDCEGSEFGILENWPGPIATQLSIEFHDWVNLERWNETYFQRLFAGPLKDYEVRLFGLTPMGPGAHPGHWDSLLVLR